MRNVTNVKSKLALILSLAVVLTVALMFAGCNNDNQTESKREININEYVIVEEFGYDGYGTVSFAIDYDAIFQTAQALPNARTSAQEVLDACELFVAAYSYSENFSNNDAIVVNWIADTANLVIVEDLLNVIFKYDESYDYTMSGLSAIKDVDPFEAVKYKIISPLAGTGDVEFYAILETDRGDVKIDFEHNKEPGTLSNGDVVVLSISDDISKEGLARDYGINITRELCEYEITCLCNYVTGEMALSKVGQSATSAFSKVVEDWVLSGINDEHPEECPRTYELCGYIYYANDDTPGDGMLVAIYKMTDACMWNPYYIFIGLQGTFICDSEQIYTTDPNGFPDTFMEYEKQTVRSNHEDWSILPEYADMGFSHYDQPFAGKQTVQETVDYLNSKYGTNYTSVYIDESVSMLMQERADG